MSNSAAPMSPDFRFAATGIGALTGDYTCLTVTGDQVSGLALRNKERKKGK